MAQDDWLEVGLKMWKGADPKRQNFIVLPSDDMKSFTNLGAIPADRAALTRQLLHTAGLSDDGSKEHENLRMIASRFWTEHSSRATLVSMARALYVPKAITDRLGWWSVGADASDGYIRTYRTLIAKVQEKVAGAIKEAWGSSKHPDVFGENYVLEELKEKILEKRADLKKSSEINDFIDSLRVFPKDLATVEDDVSKDWWDKEAVRVEQCMPGRGA